MSVLNSLKMAIHDKKVHPEQIVHTMVESGIKLSKLLMIFSTSIRKFETQTNEQINKIEQDIKQKTKAKKKTKQKKCSVKELKAAICEKYNVDIKLLKFKKKELENMLETGDGIPEKPKKKDILKSDNKLDDNDINKTLTKETAAVTFELDTGNFCLSKYSHKEGMCCAFGTKSLCNSKQLTENNCCKKCNRIVKITKSGNIKFDPDKNLFYHESSFKRNVYKPDGSLGVLKKKVKAYLKDGKNYDINGMTNNPYFVYTEKDVENNFESWSYICFGSPFKNKIDDCTWNYIPKKKKKETKMDPIITEDFSIVSDDE